jgi:hypothetical protein
MRDKEILAYLAGIIDGEGCIRIKKSTYGVRVRKDMKNANYSEMIQLRMVDQEAIRLLQEIGGGNYYKEKRSQGQPLYCYQATCIKAVHIIELLYPYLRIKKPQADLILDLRKSKQNPDAKIRGGPKSKRPMKEYIVNEREVLYQKCKNLNSGRIKLFAEIAENS